MKAVVYKGKNQVAVADVSDPKLEERGDAIISGALQHEDNDL
jgi:hypothetical protein